MRAIRRGFLFLILLTLVSSLLAQQSSTTVPNLIRYGGLLKDAQGAAMASRTVGITFLIYGQQDGGAPVWLETQNVATDAAGQYNVLLGSTTAFGLPSDLFAQQEQRWLAVKAEGQPEQPRVLLVSVPYAMKAAVADTLAGHSVSEFVTTDNLQSAVQQLQGQATTISAGAPAGTNRNSAGSAGLAPFLTSTATNFVDTTTNQVVLVQQNGTGVALNATAGGNSAVTGKSTSGTVAAVAGTSSSATGTGVSGTASSTTGVNYGVSGQSSSTGGVGVSGLATALTGAAVGLLGSSSSTSGTGVSAADGATSGATVGLKAQVSSAGGTAAIIQNTASGKLISARTGTGVGTEKFGVDGSGNTTTSGAVTSTGNMSGNRLISRVATGTAPLQVTSTTLVPNLNASLLGGNAASAFALASGAPNYIQKGTAVQPSANFNISGTGTATSFNSVTSYQIGGGSVLSIGSAPDANLFLGVGAGSNDVVGSGQYNTFSGVQAGYSNTTGSGNTFSGFRAGDRNTTGSDNTFSGVQAGYSNNNGHDNTFSGFDAGSSNTTGNYNTFSGGAAGGNNTTGFDNTFSGYWAGLGNTTGSDNTFSGFLAGYSNTIGNYNTFSGVQAGWSNITGNYNTFSGYDAGYSNTTGNYNTFAGSYAGVNNTTGYNNTFSGYVAGGYNTTGGNNTFSGYQAGYNNTTGYNNTFTGYQAGYVNTTGQDNTFSGYQAGFNNTGAANTFIGIGAGINNTTGNNNIYIGSVGAGTGNEDSTIRIGDTYQYRAYIAGIYGTNIGSGSYVLVSSSGQLGTLTSSRRFKEQIRDMGDSTSGLMKLRPVTFFYKPEYDKGQRTLQYGLIAEEVAEVYPDLVAYEADGKPYTVKYQYLATMLLNEMQKQYHRADEQADVIKAQQQDVGAQAEVIKTQQQEIDGLKAQLRLQNAAFQERLLRLESMVETQTQIAADLSHQ
jgi:hypothetical protein